MPSRLVELSVEVLTAHLTNTPTEASEISNLLRKIHSTLQDLDSGSSENGSPSHFDAEEERDQSQGDKIARSRGNDLSNSAFKGLDPWLADRIPASTAKKLNRESDIHPSVFHDKLICLEDGSEVKLLRSYLERHFALTPSQYIQKWNLPDDYPLAPPAYLQRKRELAKKNGLGKNIRAATRRSSKTKQKKTTAANREHVTKS